MRRISSRGLLLVLAFALAARAETLDQALARLTKAAEAVKDVTAKSTMQMPQIPGRMTTMSITFQMLRVGDKRLTRTRTVMKMAAMQVTNLMVIDGEFMWTEMRNSMMPQVMVTKAPIPTAKPEQPAGTAAKFKGGAAGLGLGGGSRFSMKRAFEQMKETQTLKLVGKGTVLGRPTTIIEATLKPENLARLPERMQARVPARTVIHLDDATAAFMGMKSYTPSGTVAMTSKATGLKVNTGLSPKLFTYTPPKGAMIMDRTKPGAMPKMPFPVPRR